MRQAPSIFSALLLLVVVTACNTLPPNSAFLNRGSPESLLDVSSEVVNLSIATKEDNKSLSNWIAKDQPSHADLFCTASAPNCRDAKRALESKNIPVTLNASPSNTVTLVYERILAHDCNQRYVDKWEPWSNAAAPSFGCALSANMVQQVSDKREFINPDLSDDPMAVGAVNAMQRAYAPHSATDPKYAVTDSAVGSVGGR